MCHASILESSLATIALRKGLQLSGLLPVPSMLKREGKRRRCGVGRRRRWRQQRSPAWTTSTTCANRRHRGRRRRRRRWIRRRGRLKHRSLCRRPPLRCGERCNEAKALATLTSKAAIPATAPTSAPATTAALYQARTVVPQQALQQQKAY
jgi:hypothetical protein